MEPDPDLASFPDLRIAFVVCSTKREPGNEANPDLRLYFLQQLSESANSMEMSSLTRSVEEIQARIHPENRRYALS